MARRNEYELAPGWQLIDTRPTASERRAHRAAWARLLNASPHRPDHLGDFFPVPTREDGDPLRRYGMVGALATTGPREIEFRGSVPNGRPSKVTAAKRIASVLDNARRFDRAQLTTVGRELRAMVTQAIAQTSQLEIPIRLAALGASPIIPPLDDHLEIEVVTVGRDLQTGTQRISGGSVASLGTALATAVAEHARLEALRGEAASVGASGWIDGAAERTLAVSGLGPADMLELLRERSSIELIWTSGARPPCGVSMRWVDGRVVANVGGPSDHVRYKRGLLSIRNGARLPETVLAGLAGRPLGALLEHALIPGDALITEVNTYSGDLNVSVEEVASLLVVPPGPDAAVQGGPPARVGGRAPGLRRARTT